VGVVFIPCYTLKLVPFNVKGTDPGFVYVAGTMIALARQVLVEDWQYLIFVLVQIVVPHTHGRLLGWDAVIDLHEGTELTRQVAVGARH